MISPLPSAAAPRPASTVIVLAPAAAEPSVLLTRRRRNLTFFGGAFVFPGGKVDDDDCMSAAALGLSDDIATRLVRRLDASPGQEMGEAGALGAYVAACRELFEETGLLVVAPRSAAAAPVDTAMRIELRHGLAGGGNFVELLAARHLRPAVETLVYHSHWLTPSAEERRFDARFFVTMAPPFQLPEIDATEASELRWLTPRAALTAHAARELVLPPPTACTLHELSISRSSEEVLERARTRQVAPILPKIVARGRELAILLPWHADYEDAPGEGASFAPHPQELTVRCFVMRDGRFDAVE